MSHAYPYRLRYERAKWRFAHWLQRVLGLSNPREVVDTREGIRWALDPNDYQQASFLWLWERWDKHHMLRFVNRDSVIFDIGANFGYYAVSLAHAAGREATVHAFEPNPVTFDQLQRNIELNELVNVTAHRLAFSDRAGTAGLQIVNPINSGSTQLTEGDAVPVSTIDLFCQAHRIERLDVMKIDVEGYEERVLRGATRTLEQLRPTLMIELNPPVLRTTNSSVDRIIDSLTGSGYSLFQAEEDQLVPLEAQNIPDDSFINAFCLPRGCSPPGRAVSAQS